MGPKDDFLKECMSDPALVESGRPVPIDQFNQAYCTVCANRSCSRSGANNMAFDRRVQNWQKDLFISPPRASDDDPRFANIRSKFFAPAGTKLEILGSPNFVTVEKSPPPAPPVLTSPGVNPEESKETPEEKTTKVSSPIPAPMPPVVPRTVENTPFVQGTVLPGGVKKTTVEEVVTQPGAVFTFGDE